MPPDRPDLVRAEEGYTSALRLERAEPGALINRAQARGMFDRRSHAGVEREGTVQKIEAIDR